MTFKVLFYLDVVSATTPDRPGENDTNIDSTEYRESENLYSDGWLLCLR